MSATMWAWRVIVPGAGMLAALAVLWQSSRGSDGRPGWLPEPTAPAAATPDPAEGRVVAEGLVVARPGARAVVATESGGTVQSVAVSEKAAVHRGDLLVELRSDDQRLALAEAKARLAEAEAEVRYQQKDIPRQERALPKGDAQQAALDGSRRDLEVALARRELAASSVDRARLALARARVLAPIDGVVLARLVQPGDAVAAAAPLIELVDLNQLRIEAEVDEFDVDRVRLGAPARLRVEGRGDSEANAGRGTVEEVPDAVVERRVRPEDPGRPTDARILAVKIALTSPFPLKLGQRVGVEILAAPPRPTSRP